MKKLMSLILALTVVFSLAACGAKEAPAEEPSQQEEQTFTGVLEDKKDFMITVADESGNAYVFNLAGVAVPAEVGQTVTVTYTGDITNFDAQLMATKVEKN